MHYKDFLIYIFRFKTALIMLNLKNHIDLLFIKQDIL